ncbi:MAG: hypothetical protein A2284_01860 [Deltaproteobacteria bacterium RIFOXYA12_FULL_61_11]|nr:MAG: hypothetical protein A2284_01860 [Deltaproteobacteria bacterium RIFOXYA12_FULL_61_11]
MQHQTSEAGKTLDPLQLFRLPWSTTDNGMSWLEVTTKCNITCQGCYRDSRKEGHKTLEEIRTELQELRRIRKSDGLSIAGGEPLLHPELVEIVRLGRQMGWKPSINTNGQALTPELLAALREAGVASFTFHIDSTQRRKEIPEGADEATFFPLRERLAGMVRDCGGVTCGMNITVSGKNVAEVPELVRWAGEHPDLCNSMHFILFRDPVMGEHLDFFAAGNKVKLDPHFSSPELATYPPLLVSDVVETIRRADPVFQPAAYLGGTHTPQALKWLLATRFLWAGETLGYVGPRFYELAQYVAHFFTGKWLALSPRRTFTMGFLVLFLFFPFDRGVRSAAWRFLGKVVRRPRLLLEPIYLQWFLVQQPIDFQQDGALNMCDGCPNMTLYRGKLYWSCRLEELKNFGVNLTASPKA